MSAARASSPTLPIHPHVEKHIRFLFLHCGHLRLGTPRCLSVDRILSTSSPSGLLFVSLEQAVVLALKFHAAADDFRATIDGVSRAVASVDLEDNALQALLDGDKQQCRQDRKRLKEVLAQVQARVVRGLFESLFQIYPLRPQRVIFFLLLKALS